MNKKKAIPLIIIAICLAVGIGYLIKNHSDGMKISKMAIGMSLLDLYEQNHDLVGWIRVPGTNISYPVMNSENYLYQSFEGDYAYRGTPFVMSDWDVEKSRTTMIFGHNMWVEKTMFNDLHKYKKDGFYKKAPKAEFFVIKDKDSDPYVEKRTYRIHAADLVSVNDDLYAKSQYFNNDSDSLKDLFDAANKDSLFKTKVKWAGGDELILCTCSYHISGNRDAGRILVFGTRIKTEKKDFYD